MPVNEGTNEIRVLTNEKWIAYPDKSAVGKRFPTLTSCKNGTGKATFVVKGRPTDKDLRDSVKAHENHHATDNETIFNNVLGRWDTAIDTAKKNKTKVTATNASTCERALYGMLGSNQRPEQIADTLASQINAAGVTFHGTAAGAKPPNSIDKVEPDCNIRIKVG